MEHTHHTNVTRTVKLEGHRFIKVTSSQTGTKTIKQRMRTRTMSEHHFLGRRGVGKGSRMQRSEAIRQAMPDIFMAQAEQAHRDEARAARKARNEAQRQERAERKRLRALRRGIA